MELDENLIARQDPKLDNITALLSTIQNQLREIMDDVDLNYEEHEDGEKNDFLKQIEEVFNNPSASMFRLSAQMDDQVRKLVDKSVKAFIFKMEDKIRIAVRSKTAHNDLHYCIALNDDNENNRKLAFLFLDRYDLLDISTRYPVYFQFVPIDLMPKIRVQEQIYPNVAA